MPSSAFSQVAAASALVASCLVGASLAAASQTVAVAQPVTESAVTADIQHRVENALRAQTPSGVKRGTGVRCTNELALLLYGVGFRSKNLKEAWAIAMRESAGRSLGPGVEGFNGQDWGLFQFNAKTWQDHSWWDEDVLLDRKSNAQLAFRFSRGGKDWILWGLDGSGNPSPELYERAGWGPDKVSRWIVEPYRAYLTQFPCEALARQG